MPLLSGKENIKRNIQELIHSGYERDQAIAIAMDVARKGRKKKEHDK